MGALFVFVQENWDHLVLTNHYCQVHCCPCQWSAVYQCVGVVGSPTTAVRCGRWPVALSLWSRPPPRCAQSIGIIMQSFLTNLLRHISFNHREQSKHFYLSTHNCPEESQLTFFRGWISACFGSSGKQLLVTQFNYHIALTLCRLPWAGHTLMHAVCAPKGWSTLECTSYYIHSDNKSWWRYTIKSSWVND